MKKLFQAILKPFGLVVLSKDEIPTVTPTNEPTEPTTLLSTYELKAMLQEYDDTRLEQIKKVLGFEDSRINTFDFAELKNYMLYMEKLATEKNIKLKGLSFIKGVYNEETAHDKKYVGYENLIYTPTAIVNGQEVQIDVVNSELGRVSLLHEVLGDVGYEWMYNKNNLQRAESNTKGKTQVHQQAMLKSSKKGGGGNFGAVAPTPN